MTSTRTTITGTTALAVVAMAVLAACGQDTRAEAGPDAGAVAGTTAAASDTGLSETAPDGSAIPDGTWLKTSTTADARRLGIPRHTYRPIMGHDGELDVTLRLEGGYVAQFADNGDGVVAQGDGGTSGYDSEGNWVLTSSSDGCPGCVATYEWSLEGDRLTLELVDADTSESPADLLVARLVMEGSYTRQ